MLEHEIKNKVLTIGNRKGQTVYYAYPKSQQKLTNHRARDLPLGRRREQRPHQPKQHRVRCPQNGHERGPCRAGQPPSRRSLQDDGHPGGSHRGRRPQDPENRLHPQAEDARRRQQRGVEH